MFLYKLKVLITSAIISLAVVFLIFWFLGTEVLAASVEVKIQWDPDVQNISGGQPIQDWVDYPVGVANEIPAADDRTWLGEIYLIAVYDRMLRGDEIKQNFDTGYTGGGRIAENLIALWNFKGDFNDQTDNPLNLVPLEAGTTEWIDGGGLKINQSTTLVSESPNKVVNAIKASNAFTVEVWIKPANLTQSGPARIFTISQDSALRNFTLGQVDNNYVVRCRRVGTTGQGTPSLDSLGTVKLELTHVVYAIDNRGAATIYIDGVGVVSQHTLNPSGTPWEKLQVFDRVLPDGVYDYDNPLVEFVTTYDPNGYSKPISEVIELNYEDSVATKRQFIMRSCAVISGVEECSEDSEETDQSSYEIKIPVRTVKNIRIVN